MKKIFFSIPILLLAGIGLALYIGPPEMPVTPQAETQQEDSNIMAEQDTQTATIVTKGGSIVLTLYPKVAPKTVENFVKLSHEGFYNGVTWHRVVSGFVAQGGDPLSKDDDPSNDGTGGPGYTFEDEINPKSIGLTDDQIAALVAQGYQFRDDLESLSMTVGALAMANSGPATNGSQFFIVTETDQPHLNGKHTVFGKVVSGMDVVLKLQQGDVIETIRIE